MAQKTSLLIKFITFGVFRLFYDDYGIFILTTLRWKFLICVSNLRQPWCWIIEVLLLCSFDHKWCIFLLSEEIISKSSLFSVIKYAMVVVRILMFHCSLTTARGISVKTLGSIEKCPICQQGVNIELIKCLYAAGSEHYWWNNMAGVLLLGCLNL